MNMPNRTILFSLFVLSGFSGLVYESIWTHYLKLFLGHAAYAQTLVLAIFMGGMAIGSWLCSRYSDRWKNLLIGYALAEGMVGLLAIVFHPIFDRAVQFSYTMVMSQFGNAAAVTAYKWTLSAVLILPQSILLGMTFPLMSAGMIRLFPHNPGKTIALLYFTNSIGAAVGVLTSGFMLVRLVGLPGTLLIAGLINLGLAVTVWTLVRGREVTGRRGIDTILYHPTSSGAYRLLLVASLITGAASFIYEIGWIRMLSLVLGSSTHAFELMLSAFILGLAFGGLWIHRRLDRQDLPVRALVIVQIAMGVMALSTLWIYGQTFPVMQWLLKILPKSDAGYLLFNISSHGIAVAIMLPTTFCAGMTLPLITYALIRQGYGERSIGAVYAANTIGAIFGVFFAIHFGMPLLGLKGLMTFGAGLDISLGLALLWLVIPRDRGLRTPIALTVAGLGAILTTLLLVNLDVHQMASGVYRNGVLMTPDSAAIRYHHDGKTATVSITFESVGIMSIRTNGKNDASVSVLAGTPPTNDEATMVLAGVLPMAINPGATTAANIGLGSGLTTNALLSNPHLMRVDTIEIERSMIEAARQFGPLVSKVYQDPRSSIYVDDAKTFFSTHNRKYDIIISEPSNPWVSGVAGLFSTEFYRDIKRYLNPNGLFVQWLQLYEIDVDLVASVLKAVASQFPDFVVYAPNMDDLIIIAKNGGNIPDPDPAFLALPELAIILRRIDVASIQDIDIRKVGNKKILGSLLNTFPIVANSDYYPVLDQNAARTRFLHVTAQDFVTVAQQPIPATDMLMGTVPRMPFLVTPTSYFPRTLFASYASALREYLLQGRFTSKHDDLPIDLKRQAVQFRSLFTDCRAMPRERRMDILFDTSLIIFPYLSPEESASGWHALESKNCVSSFSVTEKEWISLLKAVGQRNADAMAHYSAGLIERSGETNPVRLKYLVAVNMLGNLVRGNDGEATRIWSQYQTSLFGTSKPSFLFQLLSANIGNPR
ncbi:MAG: spermidine synthase [Nitrospirae bacterium]|nr:spermidine synthase [Nitrospirota bacterium]NTW65461.1 spermidine synthase [Nitrospirota bacterium]